MPTGRVGETLLIQVIAEALRSLREEMAATNDLGQVEYIGWYLAGRKGEVWGAESGADKLLVVKTE